MPVTRTSPTNSLYCRLVSLQSAAPLSVHPANGTAVSGRAYCTETRPYLQGARLTSYELVHDAIPATLVCDSAVSALLRTGRVQAVVVGADRVAANGDTANKIGTYQVAGWTVAGTLPDVMTWCQLEVFLFISAIWVA